MTRPVFLSVGGPRDTAFAASVKALLPDNMVYFYKRTGVEGESFRDEIEAEIQNCRVFVVFWSDDFLSSEAAKGELALVRRLIESGNSDKELLVVPVRKKGPNLQGKWQNPLNQKQEFILGEGRLNRAIDPSPDAQKVAEHIRRKLASANLMGKVVVPRPRVLEAIRDASALPEYAARTFVFISGFEGDGRRTALRQFMRDAYGYLTERQVAFEAIEGPEDLLLRVLDASGTSAAERKKILQNVASGGTTAIKELRRSLHQGEASKSYWVITLDRFPQVDMVGLPRWLSEVAATFGTGNAPLVFFVTSNPVTDAQLAHYPTAGRVRINGLDEHEMGELVHRLSLEDPHPTKWNKETKLYVSRTCGSSPSLCQTLMFALSHEHNLDFLQEISTATLHEFDVQFSPVILHVISVFRNRPADVLALRVADRLGLTSKQALDELLGLMPNASGYSLYRLLEYGVLERLSDDVYRIPPVVRRRLGQTLWAGETKEERTAFDAIFSKFAKRMLVLEDDFGAVYATNKAAAILETGAHEDPSIAEYFTVATLLKAGLERYNALDYERARSILRRALLKISDGTTVDPATHVEAARFLGLAAARRRKHEDVLLACDFLENDPSLADRGQQARGISSFIKGFEQRQSGQTREAIVHFEAARRELTGLRGGERQRGAVLTELSRAYIMRTPPDYDRATSMAEEALREKDVPQHLSGLIRARLFRLSVPRFNDRAAFDSEIQEIDELLKKLSADCVRRGQDFHMTSWADRERVVALRRVSDSGGPLDLGTAITWVNRAIAIRARDDAVSQKWMLQLFDESTDHTQTLLQETAQALNTALDHTPNHLATALKTRALVLSRTDERAARDLVHSNRELLRGRNTNELLSMVAQGGQFDRSPAAFMYIAGM